MTEGDTIYNTTAPHKRNGTEDNKSGEQNHQRIRLKEQCLREIKEQCSKLIEELEYVHIF